MACDGACAGRVWRARVQRKIRDPQNVRVAPRGGAAPSTFDKEDPRPSECPRSPSGWPATRLPTASARFCWDLPASRPRFGCELGSAILCWPALRTFRHRTHADRIRTIFRAVGSRGHFTGPSGVAWNLGEAFVNNCARVITSRRLRVCALRIRRPRLRDRPLVAHRGQIASRSHSGTDELSVAAFGVAGSVEGWGGSFLLRKGVFCSDFS